MVIFGDEKLRLPFVNFKSLFLSDKSLIIVTLVID